MNFRNSPISFSLLITSSLSTSMGASMAMEAPVLEWPKAQKVCSSAASFVYDISPETNFETEKPTGSLSGYEVIQHRFADSNEQSLKAAGGSIQAVSLYNPEENSLVVSFRGTKAPRDWKTNLGIGYCIAKAIDTHDLIIDGKPIKLPEYFGNLATNKLKGLFGTQKGIFGERLAVSMDILDMPLNILLNRFIELPTIGSRILDATIDTGKYVGAGTVLGASFGLLGAGIGFAAGCGKGVYNGLCVAIEGDRIRKDYKYERSLHLQNIVNILDLNYLEQYTSDSAAFLRSSIEQVLEESDNEDDLNVSITGHSLGRFLSGAAFLECVGSRNIGEGAIRLERIAGIGNIGFNGPAGFQGLPHLPFMINTTAGTHVSTALELLTADNRGMVQHVRRQNDLVGSLASEFDVAQVQVIEDVVNTNQHPASQHFLNNHGIKPIWTLMHQ